MSNVEYKKCNRCNVEKELTKNFKQLGGNKRTQFKWSAMCKNCLEKNYNKVLSNQLDNELFLKEVLNHSKVKEYYKGRIITAEDQVRIETKKEIEKLSKELKKSNHEYTEMNLRHQNAQETITELRKENSELRKNISDNLINIMKHLNVDANSF
jgi:hypothetical protein